MLLTKLLYRKIVLHTMSQCNLSSLSCLPKKIPEKLCRSNELATSIIGASFIKYQLSSRPVVISSNQKCRGERSARPVQLWSNPNCFPTSTHNNEQLTVRKAFERPLNIYWTVYWTLHWTGRADRSPLHSGFIQLPSQKDFRKALLFTYNRLNLRSEEIKAKR